MRPESVARTTRPSAIVGGVNFANSSPPLLCHSSRNVSGSNAARCRGTFCHCGSPSGVLTHRIAFARRPPTASRTCWTSPRRHGPARPRTAADPGGAPAGPAERLQEVAPGHLQDQPEVCPGVGPEHRAAVDVRAAVLAVLIAGGVDVATRRGGVAVGRERRAHQRATGGRRRVRMETVRERLKVVLHGRQRRRVEEREPPFFAGAQQQPRRQPDRRARAQVDVRAVERGVVRRAVNSGQLQPRRGQGHERVAQRPGAVAGLKKIPLPAAASPPPPCQIPACPVGSGLVQNTPAGARFRRAKTEHPAAVRLIGRAVAVAAQAAEDGVDDAARQQQRGTVLLALGVEARPAVLRLDPRRPRIGQIGRQVQGVQDVLVVVGVASDGVQAVRGGIDDRRGGDADPLRGRSSQIAGRTRPVGSICRAATGGVAGLALSSFTSKA